MVVGFSKRKPKTSFSHLGGQKTPQREPEWVQNGVQNRIRTENVEITNCNTSYTKTSFVMVQGLQNRLKSDPEPVQNLFQIASSTRRPSQSLLKASWSALGGSWSREKVLLSALGGAQSRATRRCQDELPGPGAGGRQPGGRGF